MFFHQKFFQKSIFLHSKFKNFVLGSMTHHCRASDENASSSRHNIFFQKKKISCQKLKQVSNLDLTKILRKKTSQQSFTKCKDSIISTQDTCYNIFNLFYQEGAKIIVRLLLTSTTAQGSNVNEFINDSAITRSEIVLVPSTTSESQSNPTKNVNVPYSCCSSCSSNATKSNRRNFAAKAAATTTTQSSWLVLTVRQQNFKFYFEINHVGVIFFLRSN